MGGYGSGRYGYSTTTKLDEGLKLDINKLKQDGSVGLNMARTGSQIWTCNRTGQKVASIGYETNTLDQNNMWIRLYFKYTLRHSDKPEDIDYKIKLEATKPHYGGKRLWFICPFTHKRAGVLYSPPRSKWFASRHAYNLKYQSQSRCAHNRAIDKMWKLKDRLGGDQFWRKPKGMHEKTYQRRLKEIIEAENVCNAFMFNRFGIFV